MIAPTLLRLAAVMTAGAIALGVAAAHAKSDWQINEGAPSSVDQTVYRPNCVSAECACDCRSERFCMPACMRW